MHISVQKLCVLCFVYLGTIVHTSAGQGKDIGHSITVSEQERSYLVHLPSVYDGKTALPLVIVLHGGGGNAENAARTSRMSKKSDTAGFIAVYPKGTNRFFKSRLLTWNAGNCCGYALDSGVDDVGFIRAMLGQLQRDYGHDTTRVYVTGMSNGAMMAYRLACKLSDKIAAIAPVAGAMNFEPCAPSHPVSVIAFHGTEDNHVLYEGGVPRKQADSHPRIDQPVSHAIQFWVGHNACATRPERSESNDVEVERYANGIKGTEVVLYTILGGKHSWPGGTRGWIFGDEPSSA
ncbi:MAG: polyhydroxybutyrate depolymerase, partial [Ignavibacteriae bacterium]|nr:polyhydroxybutyrate depolymerase [Ignavibacteriota bacterium]